MAQPANTYDSYDMIGIREDLSDVIYDISPEETPFYSACAKVKASNRLHEWQTDALRAAADNAHVEGDDTTAVARTATTRLGNYTQIFKDAVTVSGSEVGMDKAGRAKEFDYQSLRMAKEQKLDIERALFLNQAKVAGSSSIARKLGGLGSWVKTNSSVGSGGSNPTGDGSNARTDGTQTALTQARFDTVMQAAWEAGGKPDKVYLSAFQMNTALGFVGNNNQRSTVVASGNKVVKAMDVYVTQWGAVMFVPSRLCRSRDVWVMQSDMWAVANLRPTFKEPLAKSGDSDKGQVITELTLECRNEKASGIVADNTTS